MLIALLLLSVASACELEDIFLARWELDGGNATMTLAKDGATGLRGEWNQNGASFAFLGVYACPRDVAFTIPITSEGYYAGTISTWQLTYAPPFLNGTYVRQYLALERVAQKIGRGGFSQI